MKKLACCLFVIYSTLGAMIPKGSMWPPDVSTVQKFRGLYRCYLDSGLTPEQMNEYTDCYYKIMYPLARRMISITRKPNQNELEGVEALKRLMSSETHEHLSEIRVMDGFSYVNGLKDLLSENTYRSLLEFLQPDSNIDKIFDTLDCILECDDKPFKAYVFREMKTYAEHSDCCKQMVIAYIACGYAFQQLWVYNPVHSDTEPRFLLKKHNVNQGGKGCVFIDLEAQLYIRSLFRSCTTYFSAANNLNINSLPLALVIYHEIGHCIDFFTHIFESISCHHINSIASVFLNTGVNLEYWQEYIDYFYKSSAKEQEELVSYVSKVTQKNILSVDETISYIYEHLADKNFQAKMVLEDIREFWQILSLFFMRVSSDQDGIMIINKLSDFALNLEQNLPIRHDHLGYNYDDLDEILAEKNTLTIYDIPMQTYAAMMKIFGSSWEQYIGRLTYPYGITSALKLEYWLGMKCILEKYPQIRKAIKI